MMQRSNPIRRTRVKARRSKPRKGRILDRDFLAFVASKPCLISGKQATVHHVREYGSPRNDRRILPLAPEFHMHDFGKYSIERLGKEKFQAMFRIDIEAEIARLNEEYGNGIN